VITSPRVEVAKGILKVGYGIKTCFGDHRPGRCVLCHQDAGGSPQDDRREEQEEHCFRNFLQTAEQIFVKLDEKMKKLDVKTLAAICACDEVSRITYTPFHMWPFRLLPICPNIADNG